MTLNIKSPSFADMAEIPVIHTAQGRDLSPPLVWSGLPPGTLSLALIVDDPDAPDPAAPMRTWVHWLLYNLPVDCEGLVEGVKALPRGTREGINDWRRCGYGGPNPPIGRHRYLHKLYALDALLPDLGLPDKTALVRAMQGHVLAEACLTGCYQR